MPIKWQIFKVVSIIQFTISFLFTLALIFSVAKLWNSRNNENGELEGTILVILGFVAIVFYFAGCLLMIIKYFPDNEMPITYNLLFSILYILTAIFSAIFFVGVIVLTIGAFDKSKTNSNNIEKIFFAIFIVYTIGNIYSLILSMNIRKLIKQNFIKKQNDAIEILGSKTVDLSL